MWWIANHLLVLGMCRIGLTLPRACTLAPQPFGHSRRATATQTRPQCSTNAVHYLTWSPAETSRTRARRTHLRPKKSKPKNTRLIQVCPWPSVNANPTWTKPVIKIPWAAWPNPIIRCKEPSKNRVGLGRIGLGWFFFFNLWCHCQMWPMCVCVCAACQVLYATALISAFYHVFALSLAGAPALHHQHCLGIRLQCSGSACRLFSHTKSRRSTAMTQPGLESYKQPVCVCVCARAE